MKRLYTWETTKCFESLHHNFHLASNKLNNEFLKTNLIVVITSFTIKKSCKSTHNKQFIKNQKITTLNKFIENTSYLHLNWITSMYFVSCLWMWSFSRSTISNNVYFLILKLCIQHSLSYSIIRNIGNHIINLNLTQWSSFLQNKLVFGCKQRRWRYIEVQIIYQLVTTMKLGWKF